MRRAMLSHDFTCHLRIEAEPSPGKPGNDAACAGMPGTGLVSDHCEVD